MRTEDDNWYTGNRNRRTDINNDDRNFNARERDPYRPDYRNYPDNWPDSRHPEDNRYYPDRYRNDRNYYNQAPTDNSYTESRRNENRFDWQDYEQNRQDCERNPDHYRMRNERRNESYNERPWGLDRLAQRVENGWNRWVDKSYRDHTPASDFSW